jgi:hypothetical protein
MNTLSSVLVGSPPETRLIAAFAMGVPVWMATTRIVQAIVSGIEDRRRRRAQATGAGGASLGEVA